MPSWQLLPLRRTVGFIERKGLDTEDYYIYFFFFGSLQFAVWLQWS